MGSNRIVVGENDLVKLSVAEIAALKLEKDVDLPGIITIGDYLIELLTQLWEQEERFSGKRPFGNSGWKFDLYNTLLKNKLVRGEYVIETDRDGEAWMGVYEINDIDADDIIQECISSIVWPKA